MLLRHPPQRATDDATGTSRTLPASLSVSVFTGPALAAAASGERRATDGAVAPRRDGARGSSEGGCGEDCEEAPPRHELREQ